MKSLLIKDTTVSERAQIVREALEVDGDCEGIDLSDMYDDCIYGLKELADINREFSEKLFAFFIIHVITFLPFIAQTNDTKQFANSTNKPCR